MKLRDDQWEKLEPLLLGKKGDPGARAKNNRAFIDAVIWIVWNQTSWHELPPEFGKWNTTYMRFKRWNENAIWSQLARDVVGDSELLAIMTKITLYGEHKILLSKQRLIRKIHKNRYTLALPPIVSHHDKTLDESPLHWVDLVTPSGH